MTPTAATPAGGLTLKRTKVLHLTKGQGEYHIVDGKTVTQATPVYTRRQPGLPTVISTKPGGHYTFSMTDAELAVARKTARKFGWTLIERRADIHIKPVNRWSHLTGDLDCNADLLDRLERVAVDLGVVILVRSGRRTMDEQWALWNANMHEVNGRWVPRPGHALTAYPSATAPHVRGVAADCGINGANIGSHPGARESMLEHGLCLRVASENWHVEVGPRSAWAKNWLPD